MVTEQEMKALPPNDVGYVYRHLGINHSEVYVPESGIKLDEHFEETRNRMEADAMAVIMVRSKRLLHLFLLSPDKSTISTRAYYGADVSTQGFWDYLKSRNWQTARVHFLKLKSPR